jgi:membrane-bound serine protease (ClpP class)
MKRTFILASLVFSFLFSASHASEKLYYIPINTEVDYGLAGFVKRSINEAKKDNVAAIILEIDTFGGRVDACLEIVNHIESAKPIPVYTFINSKAWSAGALIALSGKKIFMTPGSSMGSAMPVSGGTGKSEALGEKHVSAIRAQFGSIAEKNGYPANIAEAMVDKDMEIKEVMINGKKMYLTEDEIEIRKKKQKINVLEIVTKKDKLLNLTANKAKQYGIASEVADNLKSVMEYLNLGSTEVVKKERNWSENVAGFFTGSMISGLLLMIGLMALYIEFSHPGFGWAGVAGIICLALLFWGKYLASLAELTEIIIFAIGLVLIFLEIFVIPGFGITGISGILFIAIGLYLAFVPFTVPKYPWDMKLLQETLLIVMGSLTVSIFAFLTLVRFLPKIPGVNRLVLTAEQRAEKGFSVVDSEIQSMTGRKGLALTNLRPVGRARFGSTILDVVSDGEYINKGAKIVIFEVSGNRILVRQC